MKKYLLFFTFLLIIIPSSWAVLLDTTYTAYENGEFTTTSIKRIKVSNTSAINSVQDLVEQFNSTPSKLFEWALKDLGFQGQKDKDLIINLKSATFDKKTGITHGIVDVIVPGITTFKDIKVDAIVECKTHTNSITKANADVLYSDMLLKKAYGIITIIPHRNHEVNMISVLKVRFGWFFNIFITQKRYKSIVEWRVKKFAENMAIASEKIEKQKNK